MDFGGVAFSVEIVISQTHTHATARPPEDLLAVSDLHMHTHCLGLTHAHSSAHTYQDTSHTLTHSTARPPEDFLAFSINTYSNPLKEQYIYHNPITQ